MSYPNKQVFAIAVSAMTIIQGCGGGSSSTSTAPQSASMDKSNGSLRDGTFNTGDPRELGNVCLTDPRFKNLNDLSKVSCLQKLIGSTPTGLSVLETDAAEKILSPFQGMEHYGLFITSHALASMTYMGRTVGLGDETSFKCVSLAWGMKSARLEVCRKKAWIALDLSDPNDAAGGYSAAMVAQLEDGGTEEGDAEQFVVAPQKPALLSRRPASYVHVQPNAEAVLKDLLLSLTINSSLVRAHKRDDDAQVNNFDNNCGYDMAMSAAPAISGLLCALNNVPENPQCSRDSRRILPDLFDAAWTLANGQCKSANVLTTVGEDPVGHEWWKKD